MVGIQVLGVTCRCANIALNFRHRQNTRLQLLALTILQQVM